MAHFAQLDENNVVTQVIVVSNDDCSRGAFGMVDLRIETGSQRRPRAGCFPKAVLE